MSVDVAVPLPAGTTDQVVREWFVPVTGQVERGEAAPAGAVLFPAVGDFVQVPRPGEEGVLRGYWVGLAPGSGEDGDGMVSARVLSGIEMVEYRAWAINVGAEAVVSGRAEPGSVQEQAARAVAALCARRDSERAEDAAWRSALSEAAGELADRHNWCEEFDDFMAEWGLPRRVGTYLLEITVTGTVSVTVEASDGDSAEEAVTRSQIIEAAYERMDDLDYEVTGTERA